MRRSYNCKEHSFTKSFCYRVRTIFKLVEAFDVISKVLMGFLPPDGHPLYHAEDPPFRS